MGVYQNAKVAGDAWASVTYLSISLSLNVLLTLIIVIRLIVHARNTRAALGMAGIGGISKGGIRLIRTYCDYSCLFGAYFLMVNAR